WLRLTQTLGRGGDTRELAGNALTGILRIIGSESGALWLTSDGKRYEPASALPAGTAPRETYDASHPLVHFLRTTGWVVDSLQYRQDPERYEHAFGAPASGVLPEGMLIVPLDRQGFLQGFVVVSRSEAVR